MDGESLSPRHREELRQSAISDGQITARGYQTITNPRMLPPAFTGEQRRLTGLLIPIPNTNGEIAAWQLKPDSPRTIEGKPAKYEYAKGGRICLDVPAAARPYLLDADADLWITEGAKKVDSAVSNGIHSTIGVQGVWMWRRDGVALPDWNDVLLRGRTCIIAFDSDVMTKASVRSALTELSRFLEHRGATVRYCLMPDLPTGEKCGLDDAFASGKTRLDLEDMIVDALPGQSTEPATLQTRRASEIEPQLIDWLWPGWLPLGMVGLFAGYGGSGKSTVALSIAAACSTGGPLPDGQGAPLLDTLILAAEDSPAHTIIPRLVAMKADRDRIHIVDGIARTDDDPGWVQLRAHAPLIEQTVRQHRIGLVIIDPVSSYIGDANGDKESDVRSALMPVVAMAERTGCAVLLIRHVSKAGDGQRVASRILGSTAWHDIPRVAWMLADAPDDHQSEPHEDGARDTRRVLGVVKSNLAAKPQARMCIQPVDGALHWMPDGSDVTIDACFFSQSDRGSKVENAEEWALDRLKGGSVESRILFNDARRHHIAEKTLRRALDRINAESFQIPGKAHAGHSWRLPNGDRGPSGSLGQVTPV